MKNTCTKCQKEKNDNCFSWKNKEKNKKHSICKDCQKATSNDWYKENKNKHIKNVNKNNKNYIERNREFVWSYLSNKFCIDCGECDPVVLEFDHRNPDDKKHSVSNLILRKVSLQTLQEEIKKCDIRCANCHRKKTSKQFGWWMVLQKGI